MRTPDSDRTPQPDVNTGMTTTVNTVTGRCEQDSETRPHDSDRNPQPDVNSGVTTTVNTVTGRRERDSETKSHDSDRNPQSDVNTGMTTTVNTVTGRHIRKLSSDSDDEDSPHQPTEPTGWPAPPPILQRSTTISSYVSTATIPTEFSQQVQKDMADIKGQLVNTNVRLAALEKRNDFLAEQLMALHSSVQQMQATLSDVVSALQKASSAGSVTSSSLNLPLCTEEAYENFLRRLSVDDGFANEAQAYLEDTCAALEDRILEKFVDGVTNPDIRRQFMQDPPKTLKAALDIARDEEVIHAALPTSPGPSFSVPAGPQGPNCYSARSDGQRLRHGTTTDLRHWDSSREMAVGPHPANTWPRLPFIVGVFSGPGKPDHLDDFLDDCVDELKDLLASGLRIPHTQNSVKCARRVSLYADIAYPYCLCLCVPLCDNWTCSNAAAPTYSKSASSELGARCIKTACISSSAVEESQATTIGESNQRRRRRKTLSECYRYRRTMGELAIGKSQAMAIG
ncbi:hypothetical protein SprV_0301151600 [Sparganum proliferum]